MQSKAIEAQARVPIYLSGLAKASKFYDFRIAGVINKKPVNE